MKTSKLKTLTSQIILVLLFSIAACDLVNPISPGSQDYIPLAVGNQWEFTRVRTRYGTTPNGSYTASRKTYIREEVISAKKTDTSEVFTIVSFFRTEDGFGGYRLSYDTSDIERTSNRIGKELLRTGKDSILLVTYPWGYDKYRKGVGLIESSSSGYFHITAGNQGEETYNSILTKYIVK